jgi:hypothetical protein
MEGLEVWIHKEATLADVIIVRLPGCSTVLTVSQAKRYRTDQPR